MKRKYSFIYNQDQNFNGAYYCYNVKTRKVTAVFDKLATAARYIKGNCNLFKRPKSDYIPLSIYNTYIPKVEEK